MMAQKKNVFLLHPENRNFLKSREGKPILKKTIWSSLSIFFIGMMIISALSLFLFSLILPHYATLARSRTTIVATIVDKRIEKGVDLDNEYWFDYEYTVEGVVYEGEDMLGRAEYNNYSIGTPIEIVYSPEQPSLSMIEYEPIAVLAMTGLMVLFFGVGLAGYLVSLLKWWDRRLLGRKGKVIKGTIDDAQWSMDPEDDSTKLVLNYTFRSPSNGRTIQKREVFYSVQSSETLPAGTLVAVLYMEDDLFQLL